MAIKEILIYPNPLLRKKAEIVTNHKDLIQLYEDLEDTLENVDTGYAIAAPQIGVNKRIFVTNQNISLKIALDKNSSNIERELSMQIPSVIINPKIVNSSGKQLLLREGCLSFPNFYLDVKRWENVAVEYDTILKINSTFIIENHKKEYCGIWSQVFQHEIDHLDGKLFVDALSYDKKIKIAKAMRGK